MTFFNDAFTSANALGTAVKIQAPSENKAQLFFRLVQKKSIIFFNSKACICFSQLLL